MTKKMREVLGSMTAKELKRHISRSNIKRYTRMGKKALIELIIANKGRFKHLNPDVKIVRKDEKGKYITKLKEQKYGTDKPRTFKRKIPVPRKSVAQQSTRAPVKTGLRKFLKSGKLDYSFAVTSRDTKTAPIGGRQLAPRTLGTHGSTWGVKATPQSPGLMMT